MVSWMCTYLQTHQVIFIMYSLRYASIPQKVVLKNQKQINLKRRQCDPETLERKPQKSKYPELVKEITSEDKPESFYTLCCKCIFITFICLCFYECVKLAVNELIYVTRMVVQLLRSTAVIIIYDKASSCW